jgi:hypothetical protein
MRRRTFWHGTRSLLPFEEFDPKLTGTGFVSHGNRYDGFFFTSERENATFYSEFLICKVSLQDTKPGPPGVTHMPTLLRMAVEHGLNYCAEGVLDGVAYSMIVVVPVENARDIHILRWELIADDEDYFAALNEMFSDDSGEWPDRDDVAEVIAMTGGGLDYLLKFPPFKRYWGQLS